MEPWVAKLISLLIVFVLSVSANLIPLCLSKYLKDDKPRGAKTLSYFMCFGGGVFFATSFLTLLPEAYHIIDSAIIIPYGIQYPLAELFLLVGFFIILFMDLIVTKFNGSLKKGEWVTSDYSTFDVTDDVDHNSNSPSIRSLLLLAAASVHHVFEGLSIGLQAVLENVVLLSLAITTHEVVVAFSIGLQTMNRFTARGVVVAAVVCHAMLPVGAVIGICLSSLEYNNSVKIANGVLQSLVIGTFIHVTFVEILWQELGRGGLTVGKVLCLLAGSAWIALLQLIPVHVP